jgi:hypothetical protein
MQDILLSDLDGGLLWTMNDGWLGLGSRAMWLLQQYLCAPHKAWPAANPAG